MSASYRLYLALYRLYLALYCLYLALCGPIRGGRHRVHPEFEAKSTVRCRLIWPYTASHVFHWELLLTADNILGHDGTHISKN